MRFWRAANDLMDRIGVPDVRLEVYYFFKFFVLIKLFTVG